MPVTDETLKVPSGDGLINAVPDTPDGDGQDGRRASSWRSLARHFLFGSPLALVCTGVIVLWVIAAVVGPLLLPYDGYALNLTERLSPPSLSHWLGTDEFGRDVLTRLLLGARLSLQIGLMTVIVSMILGTMLGAVAGFSRRLSGILMRFTDALLAFPALLFAIFLVAVVGQGFWSLLLALTTVYTPLFARIAFGEVRALAQLDYAQAAKALGCSRTRIVLRHLLPQMSSPLIVQASYVLAAAVLFEASLSFIGVGVPPPTPSWGSMVSAGRGYMTQASWTLWPAAAALTSLVLSTSLLGDRLRDILDPRNAGGIL